MLTLGMSIPFVMYANIDNYVPDRRKQSKKCRNLTSGYFGAESAGDDVDAALDGYNRPGARKIEEFVDMLSNWYVRRSRAVSGRARDTDKLSATIRFICWSPSPNYGAVHAVSGEECTKTWCARWIRMRRSACT